MESLPPSRKFRGVAILAVPLALFFVLLEMIKAARGASWSGFEAGIAPGMALGALLYWGVIVVVGCAVARVVQMFGRGRVAPRVAVSAGALFGAAVLWGCLSVYREQTPTLDDALVLSALLGVAISYVLFRLLRLGGPVSHAILLCGVLLCGISALLAAGQVFLFDTDRSRLLTVCPGVAMALAAAFGVAFWLPRGRVGVLARGLYIPLAAGIPLLAGLFALAPPCRGEVPKTPNLVFVVSDTLRADYLSLYGGGVPTPALEALGAGGTVFENVCSLAPWTMPSMEGMWTSQYPAGFSPDGTPDEWTDQSWRYCKDTGIETLAQKLKARGYRTAALVSNALIWGMPDVMRGYDTRVMTHPIMLTSGGIFSGMPFLTDALRAWWPALVDERPHNTTRALDHYVQSWLHRFQGESFCLYVHYIDPHAPYDPPARYRTMTGAWPFFYPYPGGERWGIPVLGPDHYMPEKDRPYVTDLYRGEVRYLDEFVGRLTDCLKQAGEYENTIIVFTSDHGEELWDHGKFAHGQSVHAESVHVPLMLRGPGIQPRKIAGRVSAIDVLPTVAGLLDLTPEKAWRGRDLSGVLRGETPMPPPLPIFAQATNNKCFPWPQQMVIEGDWKLIRENGSDGRMLYNLADDPTEQHNLAREFSDRVVALEALIDAWLGTFDSTFTAGDDATNGLSREAVDRLRGMGYL